MPLIIRLSDSVAPLVKMISFGVALMSEAICWREVSGLFAGPAEGMVPAGGIAEFLGEVRQHRFDHAGVNRGSRVIVHVNWQFDGHIPSSPKSLAQRARARTALRSSAK